MNADYDLGDVMAGKCRDGLERAVPKHLQPSQGALKTTQLLRTDTLE
ncbi:hypothetical protein [Polaromonas sp. C04]|nr:hypothetical protein [Polaromonas sp. C04]